MAVPMMIHEDDAELIKDLKKKIGAKTNIDVIREGLKLLNLEVQRRERVKQWEKAVRLSKKTSQSINKEFRGRSRIRNVS